MLVIVLVEEIDGTVTPSTEITPAETRAIVVSEACPNSIEPTPSAVEVEAVIPATGNPVQFVRVPEVGVPNTGVVKFHEVAFDTPVNVCPASVLARVAVVVGNV